MPAIRLRPPPWLLLATELVLHYWCLAAPVRQALAGGGSVRIASWGSCNLAGLPERVAALNAACCPAETLCEDGVPGRCSAGCAQEYLPFYLDCRHGVALRREPGTSAPVPAC